MCEALRELMKEEIEQELEKARKEGLRLGKEEGKQIGEQQGMQQGIQQGRIAELAALVRENLLDIEKAAKRVGMTTEEFRAVMEK